MTYVYPFEAKPKQKKLGVQKNRKSKFIWLHKKGMYQKNYCKNAKIHLETRKFDT